MFTGIIQEVAEVVARVEEESGLRLFLRTRLAVSPGDSLAVNGACLTVEALEGEVARFWLSEETLSRTTLGHLVPGRLVNLEPALRVGDPLAGHLVLGHVDTVGEVLTWTPAGAGGWFEVRVPPALLRYLPLKGSVAIDGVSLTIAERDSGGRLGFALVPATLERTTLSRLATGDLVNVEIDPIARYLETLLSEHGPGVNPREKR